MGIVAWSFENPIYCLVQRFSTWGTCTPGGTRTDLGGYANLFESYKNFIKHEISSVLTFIVCSVFHSSQHCDFTYNLNGFYLIKITFSHFCFNCINFWSRGTILKQFSIWGYESTTRLRIAGLLGKMKLSWGYLT
jgi:hypothetical protein